MRLETHQLRQHLCAWDDGNRTLPGFNNLRIVFAHGGRANYHICIANVLSPVPFLELNAQRFKPLRDFRTLQVRTRNIKARVNQNLSYARHAYAAYAYEMNMLNTTKHKLTAVFDLCTLVFALLEMIAISHHTNKDQRSKTKDQFLYQIYCCCRSVAACEFAALFFHSCQLIRRFYQQGNLFSEPFACQIFLQDHSRSARRFERFGILALMIVRRLRERDHDCRLASRDEFCGRRRSSARDD